MTSDAFNTFNERIKEIKILRSKLVAIEDIKLNDSNEYRSYENAINRASIVMLCSHFQGYIEDVILEFLYNVINGNVSARMIPPRLKHELCREGLEPLSKDFNDNLPSKIESFIGSHHDLWCTDQVLISDNYPPLNEKQWILGEPGSEKIVRIIKKIGMADPWNEILKVPTNKLLKTRLNTLVHKRNYIAHGVIDTSASSLDIEAQIKSTMRLVSVFDNLLQRHYQSIRGIHMLCIIDGSNSYPIIDDETDEGIKKEPLVLKETSPHA